MLGPEESTWQTSLDILLSTWIISVIFLFALENIILNHFSEIISQKVCITILGKRPWRQPVVPGAARSSGH